MDIKQAIAFNLSSSEFLVNGYLADLESNDLLMRPVPGANHIAWQLGHLISAERFVVEKAVPGTMDALPEGFVDRHKKVAAPSDSASDFLSKDEYLQLAKKVRANTLRVVEGLSPADFDKPATGGPPFIKSVGDVFLFVSGHWLIMRDSGQLFAASLADLPCFEILP